MGIFRIPIEKDTTISTWASIPTLRELGNAGASQIVDVWAHYNEEKNLKFLTRILAKCSLTALQADIAAGTVPSPVSDSSVTCNLKFFNINHSEEQAYDFSLHCFPITQPWTEGRGTRIDSFTNAGYASWVSASTTAAWVTTGGDYKIDAASATQYFESGFEDLSINIRTMLVNWLNGTSANHGFILRMDGTAEALTGSSSTNTQYYRKSFHGRITNFPPYAPYVQLEWNDLITDDRKAALLGNTVNLYFYNAPNGIYTDIDSSATLFPGTISICATTGSVWSKIVATSATAGRVSAGIYKYSFTLPSSASVFSSFRDVWTVTSSSSAQSSSATTLTFTPKVSISSENAYVNYEIYANVPSWSTQYEKDEKQTFKVYFVEKTGANAPLVQSEQNSISSIAASTVTNFIATNGYYQILTAGSNTVDVDWQQLGYDGSSNYMSLNMNNFARNVKYYVQFRVNLRGQTKIFGEKGDFSFIVK